MQGHIQRAEVDHLPPHSSPTPLRPSTPSPFVALPVDDAHLTVQICKAAEDLSGDICEVLLLNALAVLIAYVGERPTVHIFHYGGDGAVLEKTLVVADHVGVVGRVQHPELPGDLLAQLVRLHVELDNLEYKDLTRDFVLYFADNAAAAAPYYAIFL